jgi:N-acetylmuramoyl-L-alanine amidase
MEPAVCSSPSEADSSFMTRRRATRRGRRLGVAVVVVAVLVAIVAVLADQGGNSHPTAQTGTALDPSYFASGACMAFAPVVGNNHKTVFLDAGHGGIDPGGIGTTEAGQTIYESDVNLAIVLDTMALLRDHGYRVVVSRTDDTTVLRLGPADTDEGVLSELGSHDDVAARDVCANLARADLLVGVYQDAGGTQQNAGSVTVYDPDRPFSNDNLKLANLLQGDVLSAMNAHGWQIPNDGVQPDGTFGSAVGNPSSNALAAEAASYNHLMLLGPAASGYFSTPSQMPGAVIEPLYLTDPFEGTIAASSADQKIIAQGIADAVAQYFAPAHTAKSG